MYNQKPLSGDLIDYGDPLSQGLVGLWLFNEGLGDKVFDLSGNGNNGIFDSTVPPTWTGEGVEFKDDNSYIECPDSDIILNSEGTIVFGYRQTNNPLGHYYICLAKTVVLEFGIWRAVDGGAVSWYINDTAASPGAVLDDLFDGSNRTAAFTWSDINNARKGYVDGIEVFNDSTAFTWSSAGLAGHNFVIGGRTNSVNRFMGGICKYFTVYNRVLSISEIALLYRESFRMVRTRKRRIIYDEIAGAPPGVAPTGNIWGPLGGCLRGVA